MIMTNQGVGDDEAFDVLRRASQRMNVMLREVADRIVHPPPEDPVERADSTTRLEGPEE
jgi:hypothetical protein